MKRMIKRSVIAILALIGLLMVTGCEDEPSQEVYGPPVYGPPSMSEIDE